MVIDDDDKELQLIVATEKTEHKEKDPHVNGPNGNGVEFIKKKLHGHEEKIDYLVRMRDIDHENVIGLRRAFNVVEREVGIMRSDVGRLIGSHNRTQDEIKTARNESSELMGELLLVAARLERAKERDTLHDAAIEEHGKTIEQYKRDRTVIVIGWKVAMFIMGGILTITGFLLKYGHDIAKLLGSN